MAGVSKAGKRCTTESPQNNANMAGEESTSVRSFEREMGKE